MIEQILTCSKCGKQGSIDLFRKNRSVCKMCTNTQRKNNTESYEKSKERKRQFLRENPEKKKNWNKNYYKNNAEKLKIKALGYRKGLDPEKARERYKKLYQKDPKKAHEKTRKWYAKNPEAMKNRNLKVVKNLPDHYVRAKIGLKKDQATPELIELKRIQLQLTRELRKQKQCQL